MKVNCKHAHSLQVIDGGAKLECAIGVKVGTFGSMWCGRCPKRQELDLMKGGPAIVGKPSEAEGRMISAEEAKRTLKAGGCCGAPANNPS